MKRRIFLVFLVIFLMGFVFSFSGHSANEIIISVKGHTMTLQEAYDGDFLKDNPLTPTSGGTFNLKQSNSGDDVQIYLKGVGKTTLQNAIDKDISLCRGASGFFDWLSSYRHNADEIIFSDGETLQKKIDSSKFCNFHGWVVGGWSGCSVGCGTGVQTRTAVCKKNGVGNAVSNAYCAGLGVVRQRPCTVWTYSWGRVWEEGGVFASSSCRTLKVRCIRCDGVGGETGFMAGKISDGHCSGRKPQSCARPPCQRGDCGSVLCTEAYKQGYLSEEIYKADTEFGESYVDEATMIGYHSWAKPLVRVTRTSPKIFKTIMPVVVEWGKGMTYVSGHSSEKSEIGDVLIYVGMPFCKEFGEILMENGYSIENEFEFNDEFTEEIFLKYSNKGTFSIENFSKDKFEKDMKDLFSEIEAEFFSQKYL